MKRLLYTFSAVLLVFTNSLLAQEYSVEGNVLDENNLPMAYVNVLLSNEDSTKGASTNENGEFSIQNVNSGEYELTISFLGFETYTRVFSVNTDINIGSVVLKESPESLNTVEVIAKRPTLKREADRLIFNVANTALSEGNLMEVLRSTPGVLVLGGAISVKNGEPTVYINDRKINLSADELVQLLESSPANTIKSIEVITNPSARYDAESGAVLNIVMSKNLITGYRGNVFTDYTQGVFPRYSAGMNNFFKNDKISLYANYSFSQNKERRKSSETINFLDNNNDLNEIWASNFKRITRFKTHNVNFNFDYFIDEANTISLSSNMLFLPYFRYLTNSNTFVTDASFNPDFNFNSRNLSIDDKHNVGFDLDYIHSFKNEAKLSLNGHATFYDYNRNQNVTNDYFNTQPDFSTVFRTTPKQETEIYSGQIDYELPFENSSKFSTGVKVSQIKTESDITRFDIINGSEVLNTGLSDIFSYNEDIYAAYVDYEKDWDKWNLSLGLRVEQTKLEGLSQTNNEINKQDYLKLFPTFSLSHKLSDKVNAYANYKRSIQRPDFQNLNPFQFFFNDNTIVTGNPKLQPTFIDHGVIGASFLDAYTVEAYYKYSDARAIVLPIQDNEDNLLVYTPTNLGNSIEYGFDFEVYFTPTNTWQLYFVTSVYNVKDEAVFGSNSLTADTWSNYSELTNNFSFLEDKSLTASLTLLYVGENQQGFQKSKTTIGSGLSIKKTLFKSKATLSLYVADIFNEEDQFISSNYLNQSNSRFMNIDNRYIKVGFSYKFGNTTLQTNERSKEHKERDRIKEQD